MIDKTSPTACKRDAAIFLQPYVPLGLHTLFQSMGAPICVSDHPAISMVTAAKAVIEVPT